MEIAEKQLKMQEEEINLGRQSLDRVQGLYDMMGNIHQEMALLSVEVKGLKEILDGAESVSEEEDAKDHAVVRNMEHQIIIVEQNGVEHVGK